jgi:hypothetical protein
VSLWETPINGVFESLPEVGAPFSTANSATNLRQSQSSEVHSQGEKYIAADET